MTQCPTYAEQCNRVGYFAESATAMRAANNRVVAALRSTGMRKTDALLFCAMLARVDKYSDECPALAKALDDIKARILAF